MSTPRKIRVVLTNDDGPPSEKESPNIFSFARELESRLGWDVKVVVPSSQKSWIGAAYQIQQDVQGTYYYPHPPHGYTGISSPTSRPLDPSQGETSEWILLDSTPATCANIALHNLFPEGIDLLISGPNHGRNSSSAFSISSGTIGAALGASLAKTRSIALSYGVFPSEGVTPRSRQLANELSVEVINRLWEGWGVDSDGWGSRKGEVDLYSINVPLVEKYLEQPRFFFTRVFRNNYGSLFKEKADDPSNPLSFKFAPSMGGLVSPPIDSLTVGSDTWAVGLGYISVTPLRASFAEPGPQAFQLAGKHDAGPDTGVGREWLISNLPSNL